MPMLTHGAIERLRRVNKGQLTSLATIEHPATSPGAGGANTGAGARFVVVGGSDVDPLPCRISPLGAGTPNEADQPVALDRWLVAFDLGDTPIGAGDRVTVTGEDVDGAAYTRRLIILSAQAPRTTSAMRLYVAEDAGPGRR